MRIRNILSSLLCFLIFSVAASSSICLGVTDHGQIKVSPGLLLSTRFDNGPFSKAQDYTTPASTKLNSRVEVVEEGTIDAYQQQPTAALKWTIDSRKGNSAKDAATLTSPSIDIANKEADLGRLTLGFDLWVSQARPVRVYVSSLNKDGSASGSIVTKVILPVAGAFYRFSADLGTYSVADGKFDARAPKFRVSFEVSGTDYPLPTPDLTIKVDNLSYAAASYYVSEHGRDAADGRTEGSAFATLQHAIDMAVPGDVILVLDGTYVSKDRQSLVNVNKQGEPDQWIVLRAAPGNKPVLQGTGWDVVTVAGRGAYLEFRGLTVRGYADEITKADAQADEELRTKDGKRYSGDSRMNTNGFAADGRKGTESDGHPHHLRFIDNTIRFQPGAGIGLCFPDHITIEGNVAEDNCHTMRYASSGISILSAWNFDADPGYRLFIIGNRSARNQCFVKWSEIGKLSDGNGIIIDQFNQFDYKTMKAGDHPYTGRTLVQNNLVYGNGGSGIHAFASNHIDIVNNTAYYNAQSPELNWRQIFAGSKCHDVRIVNNILWAQRGKPIHTGMGDSSDVIYDHNLMFGDGDNGVSEGGGLGTSTGGKQATVIAHLFADPRFVNPSLDPATADFHLRRGSTAIKAGVNERAGVPIIDINGIPRPAGVPVDLGAFTAK